MFADLAEGVPVGWRLQGFAESGAELGWGGVGCEAEECHALKIIHDPLHVLAVGPEIPRNPCHGLQSTRTDPIPTTPGITADFLEDMICSLEAYIRATPLSNFAGGNDHEDGHEDDD